MKVIPDFILQAALRGLEAQRQEIDKQSVEIQTLLGTAKPSRRKAIAQDAPERKKRTLTLEARERIAKAQKKRWAAYRKDKKGSGIKIAAAAVTKKTKAKDTDD